MIAPGHLHAIGTSASFRVTGAGNMRSAGVALLGILTSTLIAPEQARSQTQQQMVWCSGMDGASADSIIEGCTAIIESGNVHPARIAISLYRRGKAYSAKRERDRAIED